MSNSNSLFSIHNSQFSRPAVFEAIKLLVSQDETRKAQPERRIGFK